MYRTDRFSPPFVPFGISRVSSDRSADRSTGGAPDEPCTPLGIAEDAPRYDSDAPCPPSLSEDHAQRCREGVALGIAMALVQGADVAHADRRANARELIDAGYRDGGAPPPPTDDATLVARLRRLSRAGDRTLAELLRLLPAFADSALWAAAGCRDCAAWIDRELGVSRQIALEYLRAARVLPTLPRLTALFAVGALRWSQVRDLTRVATSANEAELCAAARLLSASETKELCRRWRHGDPEAVATDARAGDEAGDDAGDGTDDGAKGDDAVDPEATEAAAALLAYEERSLAWHALGESCVRIVLELPTELAAEWLRTNECAEDELRDADAEARNRARAGEPDDEPTPAHRRSARQYRADAALLNAAKALAHRGEAVAQADRYRVLVDVDVRTLVDDPDAAALAPGELPPERPGIAGFGPISIATARRIADGAGLTVMATMPNGEVVGVSATTRRWPPKMERAIRARDRCCQVPGCTATRWTHTHHVVMVNEGGETSIENGCLVCGGCHRRLHEGGMRLERVSAGEIELASEARETTADGPAPGGPPLSEAQAARARAFVARLQRYRLIGPDGRHVAGPKRRADDDPASRSAERVAG